MHTTRREFLRVGATGLASTALFRHHLLTYAASKGVKFKLGVTDWNLQQEAKIGSLALAKRIGFDGVQISLGLEADRLPLGDPELQRAFLNESSRVGLPIASVCLNILHWHILKSDPPAQRWVADAIPIARKLGVKVILLPFFGRGALKTQAEMNYVGDVLRELAPDAEKAKVILGLEDTLSARDNVRIMERSRSPAVLVYYDVGNSTNNGFDIIEEIRWLGRERICEVHLKDNPHFLGQGRINFRAVIDTLAGIGFEEWAHLETDSPTGSVEKDMKRNLAYVRELIRS